MFAESNSGKTLLFWYLARMFAKSKSGKTLLFCYLARMFAESTGGKTLLFCYSQLEYLMRVKAAKHCYFAI